MNSRVAVFVLCVLSLSVCVVATPWSYCSGTGSTNLTVQTVTLNPDPPKRGQDEIISLTGIANEAVVSGNINLTITYAGFAVYNGIYQICDSVKCPVAAGSEINSSIKVSGSSIPPISPPGNYVGTAVLKDQNGGNLACIVVNFVLTFSEEADVFEPKIGAMIMARMNGL